MQLVCVVQHIVRSTLHIRWWTNDDKQLVENFNWTVNEYNLLISLTWKFKFLIKINGCIDGIRNHNPKDVKEEGGVELFHL